MGFGFGTSCNGAVNPLPCVPSAVQGEWDMNRKTRTASIETAPARWRLLVLAMMLLSLLSIMAAHAAPAAFEALLPAGVEQRPGVRAEQRGSLVWITGEVDAVPLEQPDACDPLQPAADLHPEIVGLRRDLVDQQEPGHGSANVQLYHN